MDLRRRGTDSEDAAADYLIGQGFTIVTRRFKAAGGELDLVALEGDMLVFVEVKQRKAGYIPEASIGQQKRDRLFKAAHDYLGKTGQVGREFRFDVVAMGSEGIRHHRSVFSDFADLDSYVEDE
jgi:putative endonuclease